jgi:hypothetical protein
VSTAPLPVAARAIGCLLLGGYSPSTSHAVGGRDAGVASSLVKHQPANRRVTVVAQLITVAAASSTTTTGAESDTIPVAGTHLRAPQYQCAVPRTRLVLRSRRTAPEPSRGGEYLSCAFQRPGRLTSRCRSGEISLAGVKLSG